MIDRVLFFFFHSFHGLSFPPSPSVRTIFYSSLTELFFIIIVLHPPQICSSPTSLLCIFLTCPFLDSPDWFFFILADDDFIFSFFSFLFPFFLFWMLLLIELCFSLLFFSFFPLVHISTISESFEHCIAFQLFAPLFHLPPTIPTYDPTTVLNHAYDRTDSYLPDLHSQIPYCSSSTFSFVSVAWLLSPSLQLAEPSRNRAC